MRAWPALRLRFTPSTTTETPVVQELLAAVLDDVKATAVHELPDEWLVFFATADDRDRAAAALPIAAPGSVALEVLEIPDEDWARKTQMGLGPVRVGRVTIAPPWQEAAVAGGDQKDHPSSDITILIEPSMGFGTGHHASTRLCTALLQGIDLAGKRVLDVGTGSGVLALVAVALGARTVLAVDDDPDAIESARANLARNHDAGGITLKVADFRHLPPTSADVVTANLSGALLVRGAGLLSAAVAQGGSLIVSGVLREEEAEVIAAFAPALAVAERVTEDEWVGARLVRS